MVSFSCEACGDVLTKKKLDQHRNHCRGASFTCLDCMVHFHGVDYRTHTSCITEDQKYQGALYKEKPSKADKRKSVSIAEPRSSRALIPRAAYVEDAPDIEIPPAAPSPPPAVPAEPVQSIEPVNVFDFLVAENTPNASRISLGGSHEQMAMKSGAQSIFSGSQDDKQVERAGNNHTEDQGYDDEYEVQGFTYGTAPVRPVELNPNDSLVSLDLMTPAAKATRTKIERIDSVAHSRANSGTISDKKRKRGSPEALDLSSIKTKGIRRREQQDDTPMADAPPRSADTPSLAHSGLTGGLNRLLSETRDPFPPTPDYSDEKEYAREKDRKNRHSRAEHPPSPLKRSRRSKEYFKEEQSTINSGPGFSIKGRAGRIMSMVGGTSTGGALSALNPAGLQNKETTIVKTRRRNSSSEDGHRGSRDGRKVERKKVKVQRPASILSSIRRESSLHSHAEKEKHSSTTSNTSRRRRGSNESPDARRRKVKAIEYHYPRQDTRYPDPGSDSDSATNDHDHDHDDRPKPRPRGGATTVIHHHINHHNHPQQQQQQQQEMIVFGEDQRLARRAESFLSFVTKGPDSERGCSLNKALKRWHRDGAGTGTEYTGSKEEEQKELWRGLRLRRNERGEVVVFF